MNEKNRRITLFRTTGDVYLEMFSKKKGEKKNKNNFFFVPAIINLSLVNPNCRLMHLKIIACVCVIEILRHDYRPICI